MGMNRKYSLLNNLSETDMDLKISVHKVSRPKGDQQ